MEMIFYLARSKGLGKSLAFVELDGTLGPCAAFVLSGIRGKGATTMMTTQLLSARTVPVSEDTLNKCLWVSSGVVSYKLCDLEYNCENCPFDRVIRGDVLWRTDPLDRIPGEANSERR